MKPETVFETTRGPVTVSRDAYMGGWRIYIGPHMRFTEERFQTKKEAIAYLERFAAE